MKINVIGAGKVGKALAKLVVDCGVADIGSVFNRSLQGAVASCEFIGAGTAVADLAKISAADITFLTTSDDAIPGLAAELVQRKLLRPHSILVHFSGVIASDVFCSNEKLALKTASVHPLKSFADPVDSVATFSGTFCGVEGDPAALAVINPLFEALGAKLFVLDKARKPLYHSGCVFASNYVITLFDAALQCCHSAGVEGPVANDIVLSLMQGALDNLKKTASPGNVLTGPIARADTVALQQHLSQLQASPVLKKLYTLLGQATVELTLHPDTLKQQLKHVLQSAEREASNPHQ